MKILTKLMQIIKRSLKKRRAFIERFTPTEREFHGKKVFIHDIASFELCKNELFDHDMYLFHSSKPDPYIIDCGANLGLSVLYFKEMYPLARVVAFEADKNIFSYLEKNIISFNLKNVEIINKAVWDKNEILLFLEEGGAGGRIEKKMVDENLKYTEVPATSIREYIINQEVDFLKIDIEGAEYEVIKDCQDLLPNVNYIFIEYHSMLNKEQNLHKIIEIIHNAGFRYHIKEAFTSKHPFVEKKLNFGMDLQLNIFCFK